MSEIKTKPPTKEYDDGWERIFGKKKEPEQQDLFDEERMDIIGQNGNEGSHYPDFEEGQGE